MVWRGFTTPEGADIAVSPKFPGKLLSIALLVLPGFLIGACNSSSSAPPTADSWVRINAAGELATKTDHRCVLDRRTGLMWEVKTAGAGLHFSGNSYTWLSSDRVRHMTVPGTPDGGLCEGSPCDTERFVTAVNEAKLCGFSDWYLPSRSELMTLGDPQLVGTGLVIDRSFFPQAEAREYWSAETFRLYPKSAWLVDTRHGLDRVDLKSEAKGVRVVRRHQAPTGDAP